MKRNKFNLQNPTFCEQSDEQMNLPSQEMIGQYSKQYSYMMKQTEKFLKQVHQQQSQCKHSLEKFISLNQFGIGLNLHRILIGFNGIESRIMNKQNKTQDEKARIKSKYELSFNKLLERMSDLIQDLLRFQIGFKQDYFGQMFVNTPSNSQSSSPQKNSQNQALNFKMSDFFRSQSSLSRSNSGKFSFNNYKNMEETPETAKTKIPQSQQQKQKIETELRQVLNKKLQPLRETFQKVSKEDYTSNQNIDKISGKVEMMISKMSSAKSKQQKIIQIFKKNRLESAMDQNCNVTSLFERKKQLKSKKQELILKELRSYKQKKMSQVQAETTIRNQHKLQSLKQPVNPHLTSPRIFSKH